MDAPQLLQRCRDRIQAIGVVEAESRDGLQPNVGEAGIDLARLVGPLFDRQPSGLRLLGRTKLADQTLPQAETTRVVAIGMHLAELAMGSGGCELALEIRRR